MPKNSPVLYAKNGRPYVRLANGQTRFISQHEAEILDPDGPPKRKRPKVERIPHLHHATVHVQGRHELDFNERQLGWILRGFVETARGRTDDVQAMFGPDTEQSADRKAHALLLELGEELFGHMPAAIRFFDVKRDEWASWYRGSAAAQPFQHTPKRPSLPDLPPTAWLPPVIGRVTSRFGSPRDGHRHEGIDIATPTGTPVIAPQDLRVREVGFSETAGRYVVGDVVREDGTYEGDGYRLTFAHLSGATAGEGQVLQRGQTIGLSGATGRASGPHLHFRVQWVEDGIFTDDVIAVDPLGLVSEATIIGLAQPIPPAGGKVSALKDQMPLNVIVAPGAGRVSIGHGIINPDTDVRVGSPDVRLQSFEHPAPVKPRPAVQNVSRVADDSGDPLAGIVTLTADAVRNLATPDAVRAVGGLTAAGGTIASAVAPNTAPVAVPVAAAGGAVVGLAEPIASAAQLAADAIDPDDDGDPLDGIV